MKKVLTIIVVILILAGLAAAGYFFVLPNFLHKSDFDDDLVYVTKVSQLHGEGEFTSNRYSAVIESQEVITVDSDSEKKIKTVYVKEGDPVKKGDKLFEYDVEELQYTVDQCKLDRERLQSEIKSYNEQLDTLEKEYATASKNRKLSLENQMEGVKLSLKKSEYSLTAADKEITKTENSIKNAVVKSSVDGTIRSLDDPTAEAYITITASGDLRVKASVGEDHIQEFFVDEDITIRSRTDETITWSGKVVSIDTAKPITNANAGYGDTPTKYPVYISLDTTDGLLIGQHVTIEQMSAQSKPSDGTVMIGDYYICDVDSDPYVWVEENGKTVKRSVELGEYSEETFEYEITSGLESDDYIAYPEERITEGMETAHGFEEPDGDAA